MNEKWGSVLRTLQPDSINADNLRAVGGQTLPRHGQLTVGTHVRACSTPRYGQQRAEIFTPRNGGFS